MSQKTVTQYGCDLESCEETTLNADTPGWVKVKRASLGGNIDRAPLLHFCSTEHAAEELRTLYGN